MLRPTGFALRTFLTLVLGSLFAGAAYAPTWTVCASGCDFTSIQAAVDAAEPDDTIELGAETFVEAVGVGKNLTIRGAGVESTAVDGRVSAFATRTTGDVTVSVSEITFQDGLRVAGTAWANYPFYLSAEGRLNVNNSHIRDSSGCGVSVFGGPASAEVTGTTISGNGCGAEVRGSFSGSYLFPSHHGHLAMQNCIVQGNSGSGVISQGFSGVTITTTTIRDNGYGIVDYGRGMQLSRSTVAANGGYGILSVPASNWPLPAQGDIIITTSTISDNAAGGIYVGGGQYYSYPGARITDSTIVGNGGPAFSGLSGGSYYGWGYEESPFVLSGSIVANNAGDNCWTHSEGHNLSGDVTCDSTQPTDITNIDPLLLPLADNGGPTPTHALAPGSPAIDAVGSDCEPTDQRGVPRPQDGNGDGIPLCDIGAFELAPLAVEIDIKPGGFPNSINPRSRGVTPVALLGSDDFDVANVDAATLRFGPDQAQPRHNGHLEDVNYDGIMDLVAHFRTQETGIGCGMVSAALIGSTSEGQFFEGSDSIETMGCPRSEPRPVWNPQRVRGDAKGNLFDIVEEN